MFFSIPLSLRKLILKVQKNLSYKVYYINNKSKVLNVFYSEGKTWGMIGSDSSRQIVEMMMTFPF